MESSHASLQHILNLMSARSKTAKRMLARCAGVSLENFEKIQGLNMSQADSEKQKMQTEANLRQRQVMDDFGRKQEAFFLQESSSDDSASSDDSTSSEDSDSISDNEDEDTQKYDKTNQKKDGVENNDKSDKTRPRSKGLQEELCALCHRIYM